MRQTGGQLVWEQGFHQVTPIFVARFEDSPGQVPSKTINLEMFY